MSDTRLLKPRGLTRAGSVTRMLDSKDRQVAPDEWFVLRLKGAEIGGKKGRRYEDFVDFGGIDTINGQT
jgi:hypothetical protein